VGNFSLQGQNYLFFFFFLNNKVRNTEPNVQKPIDKYQASSQKYYPPLLRRSVCRSIAKVQSIYYCGLLTTIRELCFSPPPEIPQVAVRSGSIVPSSFTTCCTQIKETLCVLWTICTHTHTIKVDIYKCLYVTFPLF
jgi:hypothetical protein